MYYVKYENSDMNGNTLSIDNDDRRIDPLKKFTTLLDPNKKHTCRLKDARTNVDTITIYALNL
jgi:hypothetical protein